MATERPDVPGAKSPPPDVGSPVPLAALRLVHEVVATRLSGVLFFSTLPVAAFVCFTLLLGGAGAYLATLQPLRSHWRKA